MAKMWEFAPPIEWKGEVMTTGFMTTGYCSCGSMWHNCTCDAPRTWATVVTRIPLARTSRPFITVTLLKQGVRGNTYEF